jgi:hypothetical protein
MDVNTWQGRPSWCLQRRFFHPGGFQIEFRLQEAVEDFGAGLIYAF